jgi:RsiW-degrading membrane proteinase PrsW (M82 family)
MSYLIAVTSIIIYSLTLFLLLKSVIKRRIVSLMLCVLFGVVSAIVSLGLEYGWNYFLGNFIGSHPSLIFVESFIGVSLIEEGMKWLWLVLVVSRWRFFDYYTDGVLFACGIAAGFNLVEGAIYATIELDALNMVLRSFTAVPVHFLFAIVMGFLFARFKLEGQQYFWFSLLIPVILHGLYDFFILQQYAELLMGAAILVLIGCLCLSIWIIRVAVKADKLRMVRLDNAGEV